MEKEGCTINVVTNCNGCSACSHKCPVSAIAMEYNKEGFLYPVINQEKCIHCGACVNACPECTSPMQRKVPALCYAVQCEDNLRMQASSGGVFPQIARMFLQQGGYVAGAIYTDDFSVKHIVSNKLEDIEAMQTSKYVQSDLRGLYPQIQELLDKDQLVLFTGCACQTAAIQSYLGKEYKNLYTVDVACHGTPSPGVYHDYVKELCREEGKIQSINFRNKKISGWNSELTYTLKNGKTLAEPKRTYMFAFLNDIILRKSCHNCSFKEQKNSDMTMADFWGIQEICPDFEDGLGTSYISINSVKGLDLYHLLKSSACKMIQLPNKTATRYNPNIVSSAKEKKIRTIFFENRDGTSLLKDLHRAWAQPKFDIGLTLWWSSNYGNAMTNYALYITLAKKYNVLAINNMFLFASQRFDTFAKKHYQCSSEYFPRNATNLVGQCCDTYIVGSDQTWNVALEKMMKCGNYYQLDFVPDDRKKVSYAASFGMASAAPESDTASLYKRFDHISVREKFGVAVCKDNYGVDAEWVLDPVFLLNQEDYDELISESKQPKENFERKYVLGYILNPTPEKRMACEDAARLLGGVEIIYVNESSSVTEVDTYNDILQKDIKGGLNIEDWLRYLKNADFIVTDSFHGTCFSLLFHKLFYAFVNRQPDRFQLFDSFTGVSNRITRNYVKADLVKYFDDLDYNLIDKELGNLRRHSIEWLEKALSD